MAKMRALVSYVFSDVLVELEIGLKFSLLISSGVEWDITKLYFRFLVLDTGFGYTKGFLLILADIIMEHFPVISS